MPPPLLWRGVHGIQLTNRAATPKERHSPWARQRMPWASNPAQAAHSHGAVRRNRSAVAAWQPRLRAAGAGGPAGARAQLERALQITEAARGPDHPNTLDSMVALSDNLTAMNEHGAARNLDRFRVAVPPTERWSGCWTGGQLLPPPRGATGVPHAASTSSAAVGSLR
jgi:hypothetical protein